ncbi:uncharacterized protein LOC144147109 isoform X2 [Haemaphysalis longicornis]
MDSLRPPDALRLKGDVGKNWQLFKQKFQLFLTATETAPTPRPEATKTALLLTAAGDEAIEVFNTFSFAKGECDTDYATVLKKFDEYFKTQSNEIYERYLFRKRVQEQGEEFEHFLRDLKTQARLCNFGGLLESMIRDQIVFGTNDEKVREKLLRDNELTLAKAEQICKAAEATAAHKEEWKRDHKQVDPIRKTSSVPHLEQPNYSCQRCGRRHAPRNCPAFGRTCRKCQRKNHFAVCCKSDNRVNELTRTEEFDILDVAVKSKVGERDWVERAKVGNSSVRLKIDTGSQANILPFGIFTKMQPKPPLTHSRATLRSFGGNEIEHFGTITAKVEVNSHTAILQFFIVRKGQAILGLQACEHLKLFSRKVHSITEGSSEHVVDKFRHLFSGTGCVQRPYHMVLRDGAVPVVQNARRVPLALQRPLREELQRMEQGGIIVKVTEPTDWGSTFSWPICCPGLPSTAGKTTSTAKTLKSMPSGTTQGCIGEHRY